ncbi:MAG: hypothetical protein ACM3KM_03430 [Acidobacteriaceae bacterium]
MRRLRSEVTILFAGLALFLIAPKVLAQQACDPNSTGATLCDATQLGTRSFEGIIGQIFLSVDALIGILAMGAILYSAFRMVFSRGDPQQTTVAKTSLTYAVVGLVISVGAYAIVMAVEGAIGIQNGTFQLGASIPVNPLNSNTLGEWITSLVIFAAGIFGTAAVLMVVYEGFMYVAARGNEQQAAKAKTGLFWSVLGFTAAVLAYVIVSVINSLIA